jgi:hypothetical protein
MLLLHEDAIRTKERGGNLPMVYVVLFQRANWAQHGGLHHDNIVKTRHNSSLIADLEETFANLR